MKSFPITKSLLLAFAVAIPVASFAAPASKNPQRHTQTGRFAEAQTPPAKAARPAMAASDCSGCTTTSVVRRGGTPRGAVRTQRMDCTGCPTMDAGGKCL